jgi:hypothetical protein
MSDVITKTTYDTCVTLMTYPEAYFRDGRGETRHYRWERQYFSSTRIPYVLKIGSGDEWIAPSQDLLPLFHRGEGTGNPEILDLGRIFVDKGVLPAWWDGHVKKDVVRQLSLDNNIGSSCKR